MPTPQELQQAEQELQQAERHFERVKREMTESITAALPRATSAQLIAMSAVLWPEATTSESEPVASPPSHQRRRRHRREDAATIISQPGEPLRTNRPLVNAVIEVLGNTVMTNKAILMALQERELMPHSVTPHWYVNHILWENHPALFERVKRGHYRVRPELLLAESA